ncbi:MAG: 1-acyl-sn-glycerol-3-phosphate acyltransferase [Planctomycetales bacterium]
MNKQPFQTPPQRWNPKLTPWVVRWMRPYIRYDLGRQKIHDIEVRHLAKAQDALAQPAGVLITPNHSFHYDSYVLIETSHRLKRPFHFLTAWQVFAMGTRFDRWVLQRHGCYSINREGNDVQAFKTSVEILQKNSHPLVIFPEGDIYHHNDQISPFRDGAAAIALSAAKRSERPILALPVAVKAFYVSDPTSDLERVMTRLEESLYWRPQTQHGLTERIYRFAEGLLALKELEYLKQQQTGPITQRVRQLSDEVLRRLEQKYNVTPNSTECPERAKEVRRAIIAVAEQKNAEQKNAEQKNADTKNGQQKGLTHEALLALEADMEDVFFVIQLYSYPGDYVAKKPVIERVAETIDKFEEDLLRAVYPGVRGERKVVVQFGDPITVPDGRQGKPTVAEWTHRFEREVQSLLDDINANPPAEVIAPK